MPNDYVKIGKTTVDFGRMIRQEKCEPVSSGVTYAIYDVNQVCGRVSSIAVEFTIVQLDKNSIKKILLKSNILSASRKFVLYEIVDYQ